jgi:hypothetical protein
MRKRQTKSLRWINWALVVLLWVDEYYSALAWRSHSIIPNIIRFYVLSENWVFLWQSICRVLFDCYRQFWRFRIVQPQQYVQSWWMSLFLAPSTARSGPGVLLGTRLQRVWIGPRFIHFPLLTHFSILSLDSPAVSSAHLVKACVWILVWCHASLANPVTCACVSATTGTLFSYSQLKSAMFRIVTGMSTQAAVNPTANGNVARIKTPRFREMMLPAIVATRTYIVPGRSCSPVEGGGAREEMVLASEVSLFRAQVMKPLMLFSAARDWS